MLKPNPTPALPANPMLSAHITPDQLTRIPAIHYPLIVTPKLDGARILVGLGTNLGQVYMRSLKPLVNQPLKEYLVKWAELQEPCLVQEASYIELEIQYGGSFQLTAGYVSSHNLPLQLTQTKLQVFDYQIAEGATNKQATYERRLYLLDTELNCTQQMYITPSIEVTTPEQARTVYSRWVEQGYEGAVIRSATSSYKNGRSTLNEGGFIAVVDYHTAEATLVDMYPVMRSTVASTRNELGYLATNHRQADKQAANQMGSMVLQMEDGRTFKVGTGFSQVQAVHFWRRCPELVGSIVKYKYKELTLDGLPRQPVFLGIRPTADLAHEPTN